MKRAEGIAVGLLRALRAGEDLAGVTRAMADAGQLFEDDTLGAAALLHELARIALAVLELSAKERDVSVESLLFEWDMQQILPPTEE